MTKRLTADGELYIRVLTAVTTGICSNTRVVDNNYVDQHNIAQQIMGITTNIMNNLVSIPNLLEEVK